ncbi:four-carbon acid sugar kinase family protein [Paenibacillus alginolyticus]|uniref:Four-carbon acid sugar kinase family protein n=1 Tax=Paenibacillus alginolyticus TaxID=59839 RepID=A0ABT4GCC6_9BACL|nr:four-carbon acid sugar kinase family protein [Paenibacillus alginolyticus]MCY9664314.1 four-carbon acid sugar kinase family protein [Paenibacillus alginolyticus]MCY9693840.1 four-carbon acid sugar kinase family protein [Paenibacillus alginolyticus]MEC0148175.1 four-carbon acid sugar kinase family protein [Paenibacillus alginolyticus]
MKHIAIIADDLTGASDSGVQFVRNGLQTQVIFDIEQVSKQKQTMEAVVIDTDSRSVAPEIAYANVKEAALQIKHAGFTHVYKKMDSTLRGNLGVEIDAVMDVIPFDFAVVAPAFPKIGRTTSKGIHYLNGIPVSQTEIANDPKCPVKESDLVKLFSSQSKRKVGLISLDFLRAGKEQVYLKIQSLLETNTELIVFDALTEEDVQHIADWIADSSYKTLWAGSAGLADFLPKALSLPVHTSVPAQLPSGTKPVLLVAGSISQVTRRQVAAYNTESQVIPIELDTVQAIASEKGVQVEIDRCRRELQAALRSGSDVSLYASTSPEQVLLTKEAGSRRGLDSTEVANKISAILGAIASEIMKTAELQGVILTGGDTAKAVCKHLGVSSIQLVKEIEPGIPLGLLERETPVWAVTKAGAFGNEHSLSIAKKALKGESF